MLFNINYGLSTSLNLNNLCINFIDLSNFFLLKKGKKIIKALRLYILSEDAKVKSMWAPPLTPIIGKEKVNDFCPIFNKESALFYHIDVYVPVFFLLYKNKTYNFIFRPLSLFYIIKYLFDIDKFCRRPKGKISYYYVTVEELYLILCIKYSDIYDIMPKLCLVNLIKVLINFKFKFVLN